MDQLAILAASQDKWTLEQDSQICTLLEKFSENLMTKCDNLTTRLESLQKQSGKLDATVQNMNVKLSHLSNTKYVDVKVEEDEDFLLARRHQKAVPTKTMEERNAEVVEAVLFAVKESMQFVDNNYRKIRKPGFEDEEEVYTMQLREPDVFQDLPCLIGSEDFYEGKLGITEEHIVISPCDESFDKQPQQQSTTRQVEEVPKFNGIPPAPPPPPSMLLASPSAVKVPVALAEKEEQQVDSAPKEEPLRGKSLFDDSSDSEADSAMFGSSNRSNTGEQQPTSSHSVSKRSSISSDPPANDPSPVLPVPSVPQASQGLLIPSAADIVAGASRLKKKDANVSPTVKQLPVTSNPVMETPREVREKTPDVARTYLPKPEDEPKKVLNNNNSLRKPAVKSIFDSDSDDDLMSSFQAQSSTKTPVIKPEVEKMPEIVEKKEPSRPMPTTQTSTSTPRGTTLKPTLPKSSSLSVKTKSLFESDSDDDLFNSFSSSQKKTSPASKPAVKTESRRPEVQRNVTVKPEVKEEPKEESPQQSSPKKTEVTPEPVKKESSPPFDSPLLVEQPPVIKEDSPLSSTSSALSPLPVTVSQSPEVEDIQQKNLESSVENRVPEVPEAPQTPPEMARKLNNSNFANLLNSKLAAGPPPMVKSQPKADPVAEPEVEKNEASTTKVSENGDSEGKLLTSLTKGRPRPPSRKTPSKFNKSPVSEPKREEVKSPSVPVEPVQGKIEQSEEKVEKSQEEVSSNNRRSSTDTKNSEEEKAVDDLMKSLDLDPNLTASTSPSLESPSKTSPSTKSEISTSIFKPRQTKALFDSSDDDDEPAVPSKAVTKPAAAVKEPSPISKVSPNSRVEALNRSKFSKPSGSIFDDSDDDLDIFRKK